MGQFPSKEADTKAKEIMEAFKVMSVYDINEVLSIIQHNLHCFSNGQFYKPIEMKHHTECMALLYGGIK